MCKKNLLYYLFFALLLLIIISIGARIIRNDAMNQKSEVLDLKHNFGIVYPKQILTYSFRIINNDRRELRLGEIKTSCKCTSAIVGDKNIMHGKATTVRVNLYAKPYDGYIQESTIIEGHVNGKVKYFRLILEATVASVVKFSDESYNLDLGQFQFGDNPKSRTFIITKGSNPLEWDSIKCESSNSNIESHISPISPNTWKLEIDLKNENCLGTVLNNLRFSFWKNNKKCEYELTKNVVAKIIGHIVVSPPSLLFGAVQTDTSATEEIELKIQNDGTNSSKNLIEVLSVRCVDPNYIKYSITAKEFGAVIKFTFLAPNSCGPQNGQIILEVKADNIYKIGIDYLARVISSEDMN
jgi:hypothetical protein